MDYNKISPRDYLREKNIEFRESNGELILKCPFDRCDEDSAENEAHCYMSAETGQFHCKKCSAAGGLNKFAEHFGDAIGNIVQKKVEAGKGKIFLDQALVDECHGRLPFRIKQYLNDRGITDEIIKEEKIGYGEFYGENRITIPVKDKVDNPLFLKLRRDPENEMDSDKYKIFPAGSGSGIYGLDKISPAVKELVICEGELDQLILGKWGISAITSTAGAGTFKKEWLEHLRGMKKIHVCFDRDEAGERGADHLIRLLEENLPESAIYRITLPDRLPVGGDITDYFEKYEGNPDELMLDLPKLVERKKAARSSELQPISIDELMQTKFSENEWIVDKIVPGQGITIISGPPAAYKTWITQRMAIDIASGNEFLGKFKCKQSNVLIIDEENHPNLIQKRLSSLETRTGLPIHLLSQKNFIVTDENMVKQILDICRELDIGTIIMDSLVRINNAEENDASQMSKVFQSIKKLCQAGMTVILTHHERKETFAKSSAQNRLRGSSDISASADTHLSIRKDKDNPRRLIIEQAKNRYEMEMEPWEVEIQQEGNKISFAFAGDHNKEGRKKDEAKDIIVNVLAENKGGILRREMSAKLKELANIGEKSVREAVDEMIKDGIILEQAGKGNEKRIYLKGEPDPARNGELAL